MDKKKNLLVNLAWLIALFGMVGSLLLSNLWNIPPCVLCWYQRIALYPLVAIIFVGSWIDDKRLAYYVLPFSIIGGAIAFYHSLLQWGIIPAPLAPCLDGVSCATAQVNLLGFITIPFMALVAFAAITAIFMYLLRFDNSPITK